MLLILFRHGHAEDGDPDEDRALTQTGRQKVAHVARILRHHRILPDLYLTSPRKRAQQTAEILPEILLQKGTLEVSEALNFSGNFAALTNELRSLVSDNQANFTAIAVGHNPILDDIARVSLGSAWTDEMSLGKGCCIAIEFPGFPEPGKGTFRFHLTPENHIPDPAQGSRPHI